MAQGAPGLPVPRTGLIGREREITTAREILEHTGVRLLTLTGVGGVGKTRLALQIARELACTYARRSWLVELAAISDPELVPIAVSTALGLRGTVGTTPLEALSAFLRPQPTLVILDNCEHVIDACAELAEQLLAACPDLRLLATSREPLQIAGERQYRLPTLPLPILDGPPDIAAISASPAVRLFVARAQDVAPEFCLTNENAYTVAQVCSRLGGIPLALELAAARIRVLDVEQILGRLDDSIRLLTGGSRVAPTRQQTLKATLDWSDALLSEEERTVFRRLAIFAGQFSLEAAEALGASTECPAGRVLDLLTRLVDKSLVVVAKGDKEAWYHLLEPVRQYAMLQVSTSGEAAELRAKHAMFYAALAERAAPKLHGPAQDAWLVRLEREHGNLRSALEWANEQNAAELGLRLASALIPLWEAHGQLTEGRRWLRQAREPKPDGVDPALRMRALSGDGRLTFLLAEGDGSLYEEAEALQAESLALAREIGNERGIAAALNELGMVYRLQRATARSIDCLEEALDRFQRLNDEPGIALALLNLGATRGIRGDIDPAIALLQESLARYQTLGDLRLIAISQALLATAFARRGELAAALNLIIEAISGHHRLADRWFVAFDLMGLTDILLAQQQPEAAVRFLGAAQALVDALGIRVGNVTYAQVFETTRVLLSEEHFISIWNQGYAMSMAQAVEAARCFANSTPASTEPSLPVRLTPREREVAELLRDGDTDRQIAAALFITTGTVGVHVHHILRKLGLRSRAQVAEYLAAHETDTALPRKHSPSNRRYSALQTD